MRFLTFFLSFFIFTSVSFADSRQNVLGVLSQIESFITIDLVNEIQSIQENTAENNERKEAINTELLALWDTLVISAKSHFTDLELMTSVNEIMTRLHNAIGALKSHSIPERGVLNVHYAIEDFKKMTDPRHVIGPRF